MNYIITLSVLILSFGLVQAAQAGSSNSEKLQNKVDNFEERVGGYVDDFDAALDIDLPEPEVEEGEDVDQEALVEELANMRYEAAKPVFTRAIEDAQSMKSITRYLNGIDKKDIRAIKVSLQEIIVQLELYEVDLDEASTQEDADDYLSAVEGAIGLADQFLEAKDTLLSDTIEEYLANGTNSMRLSQERSLENLVATYEVYKIAVSADTVEDLKNLLFNAQSTYTEAVAFYNKGSNGSEARDLQLLNRSMKKMLQTRTWIKKVCCGNRRLRGTTIA